MGGPQCRGPRSEHRLGPPCSRPTRPHPGRRAATGALGLDDGIGHEAHAHATVSRARGHAAGSSTARVEHLRYDCPPMRADRTPCRLGRRPAALKMRLAVKVQCLNSEVYRAAGPSPEGGPTPTPRGNIAEQHKFLRARRRSGNRFGRKRAAQQKLRVLPDCNAIGQGFSYSDCLAGKHTRKIKVCLREI